MNTTHYYPFGMEWDMPLEDASGNSLEPSGVENRYSYNGKELEDNLGINWHYYGFRMYDPAIARFTSVDPIADQFPHLSTFNYADNDPIKNIDLHGLQGYASTLAYTHEAVRKQFPPEKAARINKATDEAMGPAALVTTGATLVFAVGAAYVAGLSPAAAGSLIANEAKDEVLSQATNGLSDAADATKLLKNGLEKGVKSLDDILSSATPGRKTKGKTKQFEKDGGFDQANKDFDDLNPSDITEIEGGRRGVLEDGRNVNVRTNSTEGRTTLEVRDGKKKTKIRYNDND